LISIRQGHSEDASTIASVLLQASQWAASQGLDMWEPNEISVEVVQPDVDAGVFYVAVIDGEVQGTFKLLLEDPEFWPDHASADSAFIHRLAVRRRVAGAGVGSAMIEWAAGRARELRRKFLRLDCDPRRHRLRAFYVDRGFKHRGDFQSARFLVSRYEMRVDERATHAVRMYASRNTAT
jgi:GNAT superfamily N-acetyltransferase